MSTGDMIIIGLIVGLAIGSASSHNEIKASIAGCPAVEKPHQSEDAE